MSSGDSDTEDDTMMQTSGDWRFLTTAQKNGLRQQIASWLGENYTCTPGVCLLVELVYQHYAHFSGRSSNMSAISQKVFGKILMENYPKVALKQFGKRGKSFCYFVDLDIQESSDEYDSVTKGRRLEPTPDTDKEPTKRKVEERHSSSKRQKTDEEQLPEEKSGGGDQNQEAENQLENPADKDKESQSGGAAPGVQWRQLSADNKETHRQQALEWLDAEYEVAPPICLLRTIVYNHYLDFCRQRNDPPATQAIFGRMVQKQFPRVMMRRLGVRGESKYYYMGIDIKSTSSHHDAISQDRVVCMGSKPKNNRVQNGS